MPAPDQIEWWLKTGLIYGLGFISLAIGVALASYFFFRIGNAIVGFINDLRSKWVPKVVTGHIAMLTTTQTNSNRTAEAVEKLTESHTVSSDNHVKTHRAVQCIAKAMQEDCCDEARKYLDDAIRELK
jgi:UDP-N-acetyl-D-mannosaminuronate dehydrogenase